MLKWWKRNERHQKKLLAVLSIGLMIAFAAQSRFGSGATNPLTLPHGYVHGKMVTQGEFTRAAREWDMLGQNIFVPSASMYARGQMVPMRVGMLGELAKRIDAHPDMFYLLLRQAQDMGVVVSEDEVNRLITNEVQMVSDRSDDFETRARNAVADMLLITGAFDRAVDDVKVSQAMIDQELVHAHQEISLKLVEFPLTAYMPAAAPPGGKEVSDQFKRYADEDRDTNADGWGYKYPNRLMVQYLSVRRDDLRKAVAAQVSDIDVRMYYRLHPDEFTVQGNATTAPTTAPVVPPFASVREKIYNNLLDARGAELGASILKDITITMAGDYAAWARAVYPDGDAAQTADLSKASMTAVGPAYHTLDYLQTLAAREQKKFGVLPVVDSRENWSSAKDLEKLPGIGKAHLATATNIDFATYASRLLDPFLPEAQRHNRSHNPPTLAVMAVSPLLVDESENHFVFRVTEAQAAHAPALQFDVEDQVEADVKQQHAYALAKAAAERFLKLAQQQGLARAASAEKVKVVDTGLFAQPDEETVMMSGATLIPNYALTQPSNGVFTQAAFALLTPGPENTDREHPLGLIESPIAGRVLVVQLDKILPHWDGDSYVTTMWHARQNLEREITGQQLFSNWFDYDALVAQLQYRPETPTSKPAL